MTELELVTLQRDQAIKCGGLEVTIMGVIDVLDEYVEYRKDYPELYDHLESVSINSGKTVADPSPKYQWKRSAPAKGFIYTDCAKNKWIYNGEDWDHLGE